MVKNTLKFGLIVVTAFAASTAGRAQTAATAPKPAAQTAPAPRPAATAPATAAASGWTKKTPWGDPDLQGTWNNGTATPMARDPKYGTRLELTKEELIDATRNAAVRQEGETEEQRSNGRGVGAGPTFWYEIGKPIPHTSLLIDPPDGRMPALTAEAQAQMAARAKVLEEIPLDARLWTRQGQWVRCISRGVPGGMVPVVYNNNYQIVQAPGYVVIFQEMVHLPRIVPLDGRARLDPAIKQWNGSARGHWEGNTLVVETTNFAPDAELMDHGPGLMGKDAKVTERFTRLSANDLDYKLTVDAPSVYTKPFTAQIPMSSIAASDRIMEYACIEGDRSVPLTITGLVSAKKNPQAASPAPARGGRGGGAPGAGGGRRGGGPAAPAGGE